MARAGTNLAAISRFASFGRRLRQQTDLQLARQGQVALQALFLARNLFVQPGILDGDRNLRRQRGNGAPVILGEKSAASVFQVEHADHLIFVNQRNRQLGAGLRIELDVARIFAHIRDQHRVFVLRGISDQSLAQAAYRASSGCSPESAGKSGAAVIHQLHPAAGC